MTVVWKCERVCTRCRRDYDPAEEGWDLIPGAGIYNVSAPLELGMDVIDQLREAEPGAQVGVDATDEDEIVVDGSIHPVVALLCPDCAKEGRDE